MRTDIQKHQEKDTQEKIFEIAARLFAERGFNGVSMREISEKSKISKPMIYYYFGSKAGIYKKLISVGLVYMRKELEHVHSQEGPVKDRLSMLMRTFFKQSITNAHLYKFFLRLNYSPEKLPFYQEFTTLVNEVNDQLKKLIQEGIDSGEFGASSNAPLAASIFSGVLAHFLWLQSNTNRKILSDQLADDIIETLFKGLNE